jgi:hypothetical protein
MSMQCKTFEYTAISRKNYETQVNNWLASKPKINICFITQSSDPRATLVNIWYIEYV